MNIDVPSTGLGLRAHYLGKINHKKRLIFRGGLVKVSQGKAAGNGQVWLSGVKCTEHENNILDCKNEGIGEPSQDCTSEKAVWVQCDGDTYENAYGRGIYSSLSFI